MLFLTQKKIINKKQLSRVNIVLISYGLLSIYNPVSGMFSTII
jgi:hypothetical protein